MKYWCSIFFIEQEPPLKFYRIGVVTNTPHRSNLDFIDCQFSIVRWLEDQCCATDISICMNHRDWYFTLYSRKGVGHISGSRAPTCEGYDHLINPAQRMHLQFGLFSIPTSGPQLVHQRLWYVLSCLWESACKRSLAAYRKE